MTEIEKLATAIRDSRRIVFFGGAGVSTESGLKDYRSTDGIYHTATHYGRTPEEILSHRCFFEDTALFYRFYRDFFLQAAEPNDTHRALATLERQGKDLTIVTQNIDGLHQKAGSRRVLELHGNAARFRCVSCGRLYDARCLADGAPVPHCACGGWIKPEVVLYGEPLDETVVQSAVDAIAGAELLIVGGTSLTVYPAAGLIRYFRGDTLAVINRDETGCDGQAQIVIHADLGTVFRQVLEQLHGKSGEGAAL